MYGFSPKLVWYSLEFKYRNPCIGVKYRRRPVTHFYLITIQDFKSLINSKQVYTVRYGRSHGEINTCNLFWFDYKHRISSMNYTLYTSGSCVVYARKYSFLADCLHPVLVYTWNADEATDDEDVHRLWVARPFGAYVYLNSLKSAARFVLSRFAGWLL